MKVAAQSVVTIHYTLTDPEGTVLDTSEGRDPLAYLHGVGMILPGLEQALEGREQGEELKVELAPAEGYGERDENLTQVVPKANFAAHGDVEVGMHFQARTSSGESHVVTITSVDEENVTIDANHPLAGVALEFAVEIVGVRSATDEELSHGHVHGPDGAHEH